MESSVRRIELGLQTRLAPIGTVDSKTRTAELDWSTGARVRRFDFWSGESYYEELSLEPGAVRMGRLQSGAAPLLNTHNRFTLDDIIGVVEGATLDRGVGKATVRFSQREAVNPIFEDVQSGIIRNVSVGYAVYRAEKLPPDARSEGLPIRRVVDWEPQELSLVPIGADAGAGVRAEQQRTFPCEIIETTADDASTRKEQAMTEDQTRAAQAAEAARQKEEQERIAKEAAAERERAAATAVETERVRIATIRDLCLRHDLGRGFEDEQIKDTAATLEVVKQRVLDELAKRSEANATRSGWDDVQTTRDATVELRAAASDAILLRHNPEQFRGNDKRKDIEDRARAWRGYTMREVMRKCLELRGVRTDGMNVNQMWERSFQTGNDLANIVLDAASKSLRAAYEASPKTFTTWAKRATAPDFKNVNRIQMSDFPSLNMVQPSAEFTRGVLTDGKESYALATYGRIIGLTRQVIVNDDLNAIAGVPAAMGRAAADLESDTVYGIITTNGTLQTTGFALFGTGHTNLSTGTSNIDVTSLGAGRAKIRLQKNLQQRNINIAPRYLLAPAALESQANQFTSQAYLAAAASNINPFAAGGATPLTPIIEARLDANSSTAFYLLCDPAQCDTLEYCYLEGQEGVFSENRMGFDVDGVEMKARLDFAAKALDYRGMWKHNGV